MEGTQSYTTRTDEVAENKPLTIKIGTEWTIVVEEWHGFYIDSRGTDGPIVVVKGGTKALLRSGF